MQKDSFLFFFKSPVNYSQLEINYASSPLPLTKKKKKKKKKRDINFSGDHQFLRMACFSELPITGK